MSLNFNAIFVGLVLGIMVALDSIITALVAKKLGIVTEEVGFFSKAVLKRKIGGVLVSIGLLPLSSFVRFKGMTNDLEENVQTAPDDFWELPASKRNLALSAYIPMLLLLWVLGLIWMNLDGIEAPLATTFAFWKDLLGFNGNSGGGNFPFDRFSFLFSQVCTYSLFMGLLPFSTNKFSILLRSLIWGKRRTSTSLAILELLVAMSMGIYLVYRQIKYFTEPNTWISAIIGLEIIVILSIFAVLAMGKKIENSGTAKSTEGI